MTGPESVCATGPASVAVGGDVNAPISTTYIALHVSNVSLVPLAVAAQEPLPLPAAATAEAFTGRKWLAEAVDRFLDSHLCGYVWVEGNAGMGKTGNWR